MATLRVVDMDHHPGTATHPSPARTMIGSGRSTQPPSPAVAVVSRPSRSPLPGSILNTDTCCPASTPSRWNRGMMRASAKRKVKCGSSYSGLMLLPFRPDPHVAILFNLDVDDVRTAADGAILDVLLARPCRQVDGHHDLLAAGIAEVAGLVFHLLALAHGHLVLSCCLIAPRL